MVKKIEVDLSEFGYYDGYYSIAVKARCSDKISNASELVLIKVTDGEISTNFDPENTTNSGGSHL